MAGQSTYSSINNMIGEAIIGGMEVDIRVSWAPAVMGCNQARVPNVQ